MSRVAPHPGQTLAVLYDIDWQTYIRLLRVFEMSRRLRLTYDRGTLEIRSPLWEHERPAELLGCFVNILTEELNLPRLSGRHVTLKRKRKQRGLEADNSYWIANAARMHGKRHLDLRTDPPPDLVHEVEVAGSSMNRMSIYAVLRVPEVWRLRGTELTFHVLQAGHYQVQTNSLSFPQLASADLPAFLAEMVRVDDTKLVLQFRAWVRQHLMKRPV